MVRFIDQYIPYASVVRLVQRGVDLVESRDRLDDDFRINLVLVTKVDDLLSRDETIVRKSRQFF
jgi:hypothetical protein